jgi:hypothetical protein
MSERFFIDKALNRPIEDVVAPEKIRAFYALLEQRTGRRLRIASITKNDAPDNTQEQAAWDLKVVLETGGIQKVGNRYEPATQTDLWEVKTDMSLPSTTAVHSSTILPSALSVVVTTTAPRAHSFPFMSSSN